MRRYLLVAIWPAGMAAIALATLRKARGAARSRPGQDGEPAVSPGEQASPKDPQAVAPTWQGVQAPTTASAGNGPKDLVRDLAKLGAISCAGAAASYGVMAAIGPVVVGRGPSIDEPIVRWTNAHQVRTWAAIMERLGKIGNTWTTWGAAGTAAACLAASWPRRRWLPPAVLSSALLVDHYVTLALRRTFRRPGPPGSPRGTYPSGGCDRVVLFYGLIAQMIWREFSRTEQGRILSIGAISALAFNEACSRQYLSKHWFTDIVTGTFYGGVLLLPFMAAVRWIAGPVVADKGQERPSAKSAPA
jgi:membrane-associated phospholipid phosphatase